MPSAEDYFDRVIRHLRSTADQLEEVREGVGEG